MDHVTAKHQEGTVPENGPTSFTAIVSNEYGTEDIVTEDGVTLKENVAENIVTENDPKPSTSGIHLNKKGITLNEISSVKPSASAIDLGEGGTPLKNVPTPFKTCLFWPKAQTNKEKKRKTKEKLPAVATSELWKQYQQKKDNLKEEQEKAKEERKLKREAKQKISNIKTKQAKRKIISSSSSSEEDLHYQPQPPRSKINSKHLRGGEFVIVRYEGEYYPGVVKALTDKRGFGSVMQKGLTNTWKWPSKTAYIMIFGILWR
ncbi:hypothetical protein RI129_011683 [Pyrocoelia pectoralis]|uniref:Uncharacterized protein n=1 Tax=Pyrocoelia pectoralis TaxID=417401 RepID=A0AAN7V545_9COLE